MMRMWSGLRIIALSLVMAAPLLLSSGCGGGDTDTALPAEEDTTLNPEDDSTMNTE